jgi:hypothetical protein
VKNGRPVIKSCGCEVKFQLSGLSCKKCGLKGHKYENCSFENVEVSDEIKKDWESFQKFDKNNKKNSKENSVISKKNININKIIVKKKVKMKIKVLIYWI